MTNSPGKKDTKFLKELSETAKKELIKIYVHEVYGRDKEITNRFVEKGLAVEEDSITLLSRVKQKFLVKNETRFTNDYITGEPDVVSPDLYDTKSCWDLHTFMEHKTKDLKKDYAFQMLGYTELLKKDFGTVAFCLINTPDALIHQEKQRLFYKMNVATMENPEFIQACALLEKEMKFDDIPLADKVHEVIVPHTPEIVAAVYERIELCRLWLNEFANNKELVEAV